MAPHRPTPLIKQSINSTALTSTIGARSRPPVRSSFTSAPGR